MLLLIDNYDSFTFNLVHYLGELGAEVIVKRNDRITAAEALATDPSGIVLSPGPCTPDGAGICLELVSKAGGKVPILGVCLGHQAIGQAYGARIVRAPEPVHGKLSRIRHKGGSVFRGLDDDFHAACGLVDDLGQDSFRVSLAYGEPRVVAIRNQPTGSIWLMRFTRDSPASALLKGERS